MWEGTLSARARGAFGAVVLLCASPFAVADPTGPISCVEGQFGIGGCPPYGQVIFFGAGVTGPNSVFEYEKPVLDFSPMAPNGTLRGVVDLSQALVRTYAQGDDDGNPSTNNGASMNAVGVDLFTLHRLGAPSPDFFTFSVVFTAEGVGGIDNPATRSGRTWRSGRTASTARRSGFREESSTTAASCRPAIRFRCSSSSTST
jgi:hypothetical protein